jgi:hypothetical protein
MSHTSHHLALDPGIDRDQDILTLLDLDFDPATRCEHSKHHVERNGHRNDETRFYLVLVWPHCGEASTMIMCATYIDTMILRDLTVRCVGCGSEGFAAREAYRVLGDA